MWICVNQETLFNQRFSFASPLPHVSPAEFRFSKWMRVKEGVGVEREQGREGGKDVLELLLGPTQPLRKDDHKLRP